MTWVREPFGLYLVLTRPRAGYEVCTEAAIEEGVRCVQLRMKDEPRTQVLEMAKRLRAITQGTATRLIINDDVEVAVEADADGVHVGQSDVHPMEVRRRWGVPGKVVGWSTHNRHQIDVANAMQPPPDYIGLGPVFATPTKADADPELGLATLKRLVPLATVPVVAIGGINEFNLREVLACGVRNFAVVRAVCDSERPREAIRRLVQIWAEFEAARRVEG